MKIQDFRAEKKGNRTRVSAQVKWEDCERPSQEIYFETIDEFSEDISCNPHAFLVACIMPAMRFGEKRIFIDSEICPELHDGLITAMGLIRNWFDWYNPDPSLVRIEAKQQKHILSILQNTKGWLFYFPAELTLLPRCAQTAFITRRTPWIHQRRYFDLWPGGQQAGEFRTCFELRIYFGQGCWCDAYSCIYQY